MGRKSPLLGAVGSSKARLAPRLCRYRAHPRRMGGQGPGTLVVQMPQVQDGKASVCGAGPR